MQYRHIPGVVFDTQIDMFLKAEAERSHVGETIFPQLVLNDLRARRGKDEGREERGGKEQESGKRNGRRKNK